MKINLKVHLNSNAMIIVKEHVEYISKYSVGDNL